MTGEPQQAGGEHPKDEVYAFFQNCYHLKDWLIHDPSVSVSKKAVDDWQGEDHLPVSYATLWQGIRGFLVFR